MHRTTWLQKIGLILFGVVLFVVVLEVGLRAGGCFYLIMQDYRNRAGLNEDNAYRILCLGESTTAGRGNDSYPYHLQAILNASDTNRQFTVIKKGIPGIDTTRIVHDAPTLVEKYKPAMVVTMIGINDCRNTVPYRHTFTYYLQHFRTYKLARLIFEHIRVKLDLLHNIANDTKSSIQQSHLFNRGLLYKDKVEFYTAQELLHKEIILHPNNVDAYVTLGWCYYNDRFFKQAEKIFESVLLIEPLHSDARLGLGLCYGYEGRDKESEQLLNMIDKKKPRDYIALLELCKYYKETRQYARAIPLFEEALSLNKNFSWLYFALGECYADTGRIRDAITMFEKALKFNPITDDDACYIHLAQCYERLNEYDIAIQYRKKTESLQSSFYMKTRSNYRILYRMLQKKGIQLVCVQYPMRPVDLLKKMFSEDDILFVDNEKVFKQKVQQEGYDHYFDDRFAGDFGHCSPAGDRLLAENIARVILAYVDGVNE